MNRGFLYGDGFFETIRTVNGNIPLIDYHLDRIKEALKILQLEFPEELNEAFIQSTIDPTAHPNHLCRINFYRDGQGKYAPINNTAIVSSSVEATDQEFWLPAALDLEKELRSAPEELGPVGIYDSPKPIHPIFTIKTLSSAYYVLASKRKVEDRLKYLFLQSSDGTILEEVSSNLIFLKGDQMFVPPYQAGGVLGATLRYIKRQYGFQLEEKALKLEDLDEIEAMFSCKASTGVRRIA